MSQTNPPACGRGHQNQYICPRRAQNPRIKSVHELSILGPLLHKTQLERDHDVHKTGEHGFLFRSDHLAIDLCCAWCYPCQSARWIKSRTGRMGGEMMRLRSGANSRVSTGSLTRSRKCPVKRALPVRTACARDLYISSFARVFTCHYHIR